VCRVLDVRLVMGGEYPTEFLEIVNDPELMFTTINGLDGYKCDGAGWMDEGEKWVDWWGWRTRGYNAGYPAGTCTQREAKTGRITLYGGVVNSRSSMGG